MLVSSLVYYATLKMEAICSSETSVNFQHAISRYIPREELFDFCNFFKFCMYIDMHKLISYYSSHLVMLPLRIYLTKLSLSGVLVFMSVTFVLFVIVNNKS
jgi:hypothetical protein